MTRYVVKLKPGDHVLAMADGAEPARIELDPETGEIVTASVFPVYVPAEPTFSLQIGSEDSIVLGPVFEAGEPIQVTLGTATPIPQYPLSAKPRHLDTEDGGC